jgi:hypothetical protein
MKKKVKIFGKDVKRAVRRGLMENMVEQFEMKDTYSKAKYRQSPKEKEIEGVFGQYGDDIPPAVLRYMRKNPKVIIKRLYDVYGQDMFDYISDYANGEGIVFSQEDEDLDDGWSYEEEEEVVSEVTQDQLNDLTLYNDLLDQTVEKSEEVFGEEKKDWIPKDLKKNRARNLVKGKFTIGNIDKKLRSLDTDKKEAGIQSGGNKKKLSDIRALNLAKTFKRGV